MSADAALYPPIEAVSSQRMALLRTCAWLARIVTGLAARISLAFALIALGGVLAPMLASEGPRSTALPVDVIQPPVGAFQALPPESAPPPRR